MHARPLRSALPALLLVYLGPSHAQSWLDTRAAIESFADAADYESATALGDELLERITETFGASSPQLAEAYLYLAGLYNALGDPLPAETHTVAAIRIVEANEGTFSTALIEPYTTLGDTMFVAREYELAISAYQDAQSIGRRQWGLLNQEQLALLDRMTLVALSLEDPKRARDFQEDRFNIVARHFGQDSIEFLEAGIRYANWCLSNGEGVVAHFVLIDLDDVIDDYLESDPRMSIRRLQLMSAAYPYRLTSPVAPEPAYLLRALELVESLEQPDPELHARVLLDIGDWYVLSGRFEDSEYTDAYQQAWALLATAENSEALRSEWFATLTTLREAPIRWRRVTDNPSAPEGVLTLEFTVDVRGRAHDIRVIESDPAGLMDTAGITQISNSIFRPRITDGLVTPSTRTFTRKFRYQPVEREF